jgi:hypothetical protein
MSDQTASSFRSDTSSEIINGKYTYKTSAIIIDFRWLILPALLYIIITVLFVATVFTTRNTPMWKSSPLPLMHSTHSEDNDGSGEKIRKEAKDSWMQLRQTVSGWQMVDTKAVRQRRRSNMGS